MPKSVIATEHAPAAVGPYSQGVTANGFIFTAGQVPLDPATGKLVEGDIQVQARQSLTNVQAILEAAGTSMANVVKATVFLADIGDFAAVNEVYAEFFEEPYPARSALEVANLPLGAQVEIEVVATLE
ncbi:MAG: RidA family protein [Chloroflexota bacterium]